MKWTKNTADNWFIFDFYFFWFFVVCCHTIFLVFTQKKKISCNSIKYLVLYLLTVFNRIEFDRYPLPMRFEIINIFPVRIMFKFSPPKKLNYPFFSRNCFWPQSRALTRITFGFGLIVMSFLWIQWKMILFSTKTKFIHSE